ncbi:MAG: type II toxin-antitoxin system YafQ family toxin [Rhodomicrobiaceae bacterium]
MKSLRLTTRFRRDLKRIERRGLKFNRLTSIVDALRADRTLPPRNRDHTLTGDWQDCRECHIAPDWLLIYQTTDEEVILIRTGSHADLFE